MSRPPAQAPGAAQVLDRARGENFPVASRLFPRRVRPHLMNVYGFARLVDDLGDEAAGDRLAMLDWVGSELDMVFDGSATMPSHPLLHALRHTVRVFDLPREPFDRLVEANRQDQFASRYATFGALLDYCRLSANPVGELVLRICGACTPERLALSDATCTGLQLVEFWQDLGEDTAAGRVYLPIEDLDRFEYPVEALLEGVDDDRFRELMRFEAARTRELLERGRGLSRTLPGRVGLAVRMFTAGGLAALAGLERRGFDTFGASAHPSKTRRAWTVAREMLR